MHQQFHKATGNSSLNDRLNLVVRAIREIRNGPASIDEHFIVERIYQLSEDWKGWLICVFPP